MRGSRAFIRILCLWECAEEDAGDPHAVGDQTDEEVGGLHEPFVPTRKDQRPKGGDADAQTKKEEKPRPEREPCRKEEGRQSARCPLPFHEKEGKKAQCKINAARPYDEMVAWAVCIIPAIGKNDAEEAGTCSAERHALFYRNSIGKKMAYGRHQPSAIDCRRQTREMVVYRVVLGDGGEPLLGTQQDNADTDEKADHLPKGGHGETPDERHCLAPQLKDTHGDVHDRCSFHWRKIAIRIIYGADAVKIR